MQLSKLIFGGFFFAFVALFGNPTPASASDDISAMNADEQRKIEILAETFDWDHHDVRNHQCRRQCERRFDHCRRDCRRFPNHHECRNRCDWRYRYCLRHCRHH